MSYPLSIFDQFGNVSNSLEEEEIAKCTPEQTAVLFPLLAAWADTQEEDRRCLDVEANRRKAQTALDRAEKVLQSVTPVRTFHQEWLVTVAGQPEPEVDAAVVKKVKAATKVRDAAQEYLAQCISEVLPAQKVRDEKRRAFTDLLRAWSRVDGRAHNVGDLVKQRAATETRQKLENLKNGMPVDYVEHAASSVGPSHLDRFRSGQGKGGSANYGYNRNALRGAVIPLKLPSVR